MRVEGYLEKLLNIYHAIYTTAYITLDGDGFYIHCDTNDTKCVTLGSFTEFIEGEIKEALFTMFVNEQYTELRDVVEWLDR